MPHSSARRVAKQLADLADYEFTGTAFDQPGLKPVVDQSGPLVFVPRTSDGHITWPPVWAVVFGPLSLARNTYGNLRLVRTSKVADFLYTV